jgi:hypothetical protein
MNIKVFNKGSDQNGNKYHYNGCCVACSLLLLCHASSLFYRLVLAVQKLCNSCLDPALHAL